MSDSTLIPDIMSKLRSLYDQCMEKIQPFIDGENLKDPEWPEDMPETPYPLARLPIIAGVSVIALFFGSFFIWGSFAPLSGAAIATGLVTVDTNRKAVQHLEGGIVQEILIREGARVTEGELLIRLDDTRTSASVDLVLGQYRSTLARVASLQAEQSDLPMPIFPTELTDSKDDPEVREILESQTNLFISRRTSLQGQVDVLNQQVKQFEEEITGLEAQKRSEGAQLELIREEIKGVQELLDKGLERKPRLLALQREGAEIEGRIGQYTAEIARAKQSVLENELNIRDIINRFKTQSAEELREAETQQADLAERLRASENQQLRTDIIAPRTGTVVNLQVHTKGGVIQPGQTVLEIVPIEDTLIVQARVNPRDIDEVTGIDETSGEAQDAKVVLTAYNARRTPYLEAKVTRVSADILQDQITGEMYYEARVEVDMTPLLNDERYADIALIPGMPVEVMIETYERTALQYILAPLKSTMRRGARET